MLFQICTKCHFRSAANRKICATCGSAFPKAEPTAHQPVAGVEKKSGNRFWKELFGGGQDATHHEKIHDEPALGET